MPRDCDDTSVGAPREEGPRCITGIENEEIRTLDGLQSEDGYFLPDFSNHSIFMLEIVFCAKNRQTYLIRIEISYLFSYKYMHIIEMFTIFICLDKFNSNYINKINKFYIFKHQLSKLHFFNYKQFKHVFKLLFHNFSHCAITKLSNSFNLDFF